MCGQLVAFTVQDLAEKLTAEKFSSVVLADGLLATDAASSAWAASPTDSVVPGGMSPRATHAL